MPFQLNRLPQRHLVLFRVIPWGKRNRDESYTPLTAADATLRPCSTQEAGTFICLRFYFGKRMVWYGLNLSGSSKSGNSKPNKKQRNYNKIPESSNVSIPIWETYSIPCSSRICGLGSTIYSLGSHPRGSSKFSRHTRYGDVACPEKGWMLGPPMRSRRLLFGQAVPLEGKIYMFGGVRKVSSKKPWGEVLDPKKNEWRALAAPPANFPPTDLYHEDLYALALGKDRIVLGSRRSGGLFTYTSSSDSWEVVDQDFDKMRCYSRPVMVRSTMYWFDRREVYAYNFDVNRMCSGRINCPIIEESPVNCFSRQIYIPPLIYLGDSMFCYIWHDANGGPDRSPYSRLVCAKLDIESDFGGGARGHVKATEVSIEAHPLDRLLSRQVFDAITLDMSSAMNNAEGNESGDIYASTSAGMVDRARLQKCDQGARC